MPNTVCGSGVDKKVRIAVLMHPLRVAGGLSVGRNVVAALGRVADEHEYLLLLPAGVGYEETPKPSRCQSYYFRRYGRQLGQIAFEALRMPTLVRQFRPDVVWGLANFGLRKPGAHQAILFHKPQFIYEPRFTRVESVRPRLANWLGLRRLKRSLPATQLVFCQTRTAAERFRRYLGYAGRIAIMPNAVSRFTDHGPPSQPPPVVKRLRGRFALFCLTKFYSHKNLEMLAESFERYADELRDVTVLVTVEAGQHPRCPEFLRRIARPALREHVVNVGPLRQEELAGYYHACDGLILPTLLESFSGTYLEAMHYGKPILTSDLDFARDVCGDAAEYFDPFDPASVRDAILRVQGDAGRRAALVSAGQRRLASFARDWDAIVRDAVHELERLCTAEDPAAR